MDVQEMLGGGLLSAYCGKFSPSDCKGVQIGTDEHCVQTILVFLQASVRHFSVAKLAFYYSEYVLHLTANGRFAVFDVPFPVDCVVTRSGHTPGAAADTKINVCKMRILFDFGTFLSTNIGRISIHDIIIFTEQFGCFGYVMLICPSDCHCVYQSAAGIYTNMALHPKSPFIALLRRFPLG